MRGLKPDDRRNIQQKTRFRRDRNSRIPLVSSVFLQIDSDNEVRVAFDGPSALEIARAFRPDVVLLDIGMPGIDGYEVARRMRQMPELPHVVLAAQTGWGQEEDRRKSEEAGFDCHLVKPVALDEVQQLLRDLTRRKRMG
ncbi:MAG: response regulator [Gemmataceae bacterium]|nr:response regulator [Gemmataceae bacterium]